MREVVVYEHIMIMLKLKQNQVYLSQTIAFLAACSSWASMRR